MTENQTVWKSDNQGVKEETFIRLVGGEEKDSQGGKDSWQGSGWRTRVGKGVAGGPGKVVVGRVGGPTFACE